jgi:hypothetical protein
MMRRFLMAAILCFSVLASEAQIRISAFATPNNFITLNNCGTSAVDITAYRMCSNNVHDEIGNLNIISGNLVLQPSATILMNGLTIDAAGGDLALYLPGTNMADYTDPAFMVDYVQWKTNGNPGEATAVTDGIWTASAFVPGDGPYTFSGACGDHGATYWQVFGIEDIQDIASKINVYPSAFNKTTVLHIDQEVLTNSKSINFEMIDMNGKKVKQVTNITQGELTINREGLASGIYMYTVEIDGSVYKVDKLVIE